MDGDFNWGGVPFKYFLLAPPTNIISKYPGYHLTFQAFFDCKPSLIESYCSSCVLNLYTDNVSEALEALSITPSPDLWIAVYDPVLSLQEALEGGYSQPNLVNANGISSINLNLDLRQSLDLRSTYFYGSS